ncbi:MAG: hypothetical protein OXT69_05875 [Candidatus Poribacteria bacterium]|nr:hypothetical protein [Candidatus Poribacteria bacterium]
MNRRFCGMAALLTAAAVLLAGCIEGHWKTYHAAQGSLQEAAPAEWAAFETAQTNLRWKVLGLQGRSRKWRGYFIARLIYTREKKARDADFKVLFGDQVIEGDTAAAEAAVETVVGSTAEFYHSAVEQLQEAAKALIHEAPDLVDEAEKARRKYEAAIEALKQAAPAEWAAFEAAADATGAAANGRYEEERARGKKDAKIAENAYEARLLVSPDGSFPLVP